MWKLMILAFAILYPAYAYTVHAQGLAEPYHYILTGMASMILIDVLVAISIAVMIATSKEEHD